MRTDKVNHLLAQGGGVLMAVLAQGAMGQTTSEAMTQMADRIAISKIQQQQMDLDVKAATRQLELLKIKNEMDALQGNDARLPWLKGVEGIGGALVATLVMPDGQVIDAIVGSVLPNKMQVSAIRPAGVSLVSGKRARTDLIVRTAPPTAAPGGTLTPGGAPPSSFMQSFPSGFPGVPAVTGAGATRQVPGASGTTSRMR